MDFFYNKPTLQDKLYGRIIFQLCSSKISTWSMKSTSVTRQSWWPCLDREIFGVVLHSALPTAVSCLNYTRRKTKSKNPVKKCFFFLWKKSCKVTRFLVKLFELTSTLQSKESTFSGILRLLLRSSQWRRVEVTKKSCESKQVFQCLY